MKKAQLLTQYYKNKSSDNNSSDLLNMYLEEDKSLGKYNIIAYSRPGLSTFNTDAGSVVRGGINHQGTAYFVVDDTLYSYASDGTRTSRGTLNTSTGIVQIASIPNQIEIIDGTDIYNYNSFTDTFTVVSDADRPTNPNFLTSQDSYFLFGVSNSATIYASDLADGTSFNALSFNTKNGDGDYVNGLLSYKRNVHVLGTNVSEIWYNSGASTFSFESLDLGAIFHYGCLAKNSVAKGQSSIFYLGQNEVGGLCVLMMDQFKPIEVSNRAISYQLSLLTTVSDAIGMCVKHDSHEFYILTFPTEAKTFVYDVTTQLWSEWTSYISAAYTRFLGNCHVNCYGKNLVGAYNSGTIYYLDPTVYTDNGAQIKRQVVSPPGYAGGAKTRLHKVQIDVQTGVGSSKTVSLDVSDDSGQTFVSCTDQDIPSAGGRLFWTRLGLTQQSFVLRFYTTANAEFTILGALAEYDVGIH